MKDLIEALTILQNYIVGYNKEYPISCEHDILYVCGVNFDLITVDILHKLSKLGFLPGSDDDADILVNYDNDGYADEEIDFNTIDDETWNSIKNDLTNCFRSYRFGSC